MVKITYEQFNLPFYLNTEPIGRISGQPVYLGEVVAAGLGAGLNFHFRGPKSTGKTQLMRDVFNGWFAGNTHGLWEMGRSDFKPKNLFQRLNVSLARGTSENLPEIKAVYSDQNGVEYIIRSYIEAEGDYKLVWQKISREEKERIEADFSLSTTDLKELRNIDKRFFAIDEFNRCPEVIMNLFYGLMTGEINEDGEIIKLGDGYYSGIAASNPDDYEGTFLMDPAIWARWHVVIDFGVYEPSIDDRRELLRRNFSPGVQEAPLGDLTEELEDLRKRVAQSKPTLQEEIALQYLQSGLNYCSKTEIKATSKDQINWPRVCVKEDCPKRTGLCGLLKGIDQRASSAAFRLAKGIQAILHLRDPDAELDEIDTIVLAYQLVAPYKGVLSQRSAKENNGLEGLILKESTATITSVIKDKLRELYDVAAQEQGVVISTLQEMQRKLTQSENRAIEQKIRARYEVEVEKTPDTLRQAFPEQYTERECETLRRMPESELFVLNYLRSEAPEKFSQIEKLGNLMNLTEDEYVASEQTDTKLPYDRFIQKATAQRASAIDNIKEAILDEADGRQLLYDEFADLQSKVEREIFATFSAVERTVRHIPAEKQKAYQLDLKSAVRDKVREKQQAQFNQRKEVLWQDEWSFLKNYYDEVLEAVQQKKKR